MIRLILIFVWMYIAGNLTYLVFLRWRRRIWQRRVTDLRRRIIAAAVAAEIERLGRIAERR